MILGHLNLQKQKGWTYSDVFYSYMTDYNVHYCANNLNNKGCKSIDDKIVTYNGLKIAGLGGCQSHNPDGVYQLSEEQMDVRVNKLLRESKGEIDIFVSHAPALGLGDGSDFFHKGFACFINVLDSAKPKLHVFGHQHLSYGSKHKNPIQYNDTLLYNAFGYTIVDV